MSNNVGIDITELRRPHVSKPAQVPSKGQSVEKQEDLITIGFRVKLKEKAIIQDYVKDVQPIRSRSQYKRTEENAGLSL